MPDVYPSRFSGLSTQTKPPGKTVNDVFDELDTGARFIWNKAAGEWRFLSLLPTAEALAARAEALNTEILVRLTEIRDLLIDHL